MKTLYIVRHAKSSWSSPDLIDIDRPINEKGKKGLSRVIAFLLEEAVRPDLIISSHAVRTVQTNAATAKKFVLNKSNSFNISLVQLCSL